MEHTSNQFLERVNAIIEQNLHNESFSTADLARAVFLCRMQLHRKIKRETNLSAARYINQYKLEKALRLIKTTPDTIADISYEVGFSWPPYFSKCFKASYGVCPVVFRKISAGINN
ncbi:MAG: helix-turn-helix transcriptional regulator [Saprospirales bacterium]|nr:helix-turn-helix transcriptional regulator [Saprospirales bacterium]